MIDLVLIWAALIAFAVLLYVVMDGFDLGVGILSPFVEEEERDQIVDSISPVWDGNETWLVLGGGGLLAVFPLAYSVILTALYAPLIAMLLALVFRGVAFEFRSRDPAHKAFWDFSFAAGSSTAAFCQGIVLGAFVQGIAVEGRSYAGGWFDWLTPFSLFTGGAVAVGYALLGCGWLVMKTGGELQERIYRIMPRLALGLIGAIVVVSLWTPLANAEAAARWFAWPNLLLLSPVPLLVGLSALGLLHAIRRRLEWQPFALALMLFLLSYAGLGISLFPYAVPPAVTIWEAAAPRESLSFLLVGALVLLPVILGYTGYVYWVFRGKVRPGESYH